MAAPAWIAATTGQAPEAAQINQLLLTHAATLIYTGTSQNAQSTTGSGGVNSNGLYLAQSFTTTGGYGSSRLVLTLALTGSPTPATVTIQTNSGSAPSGTALATTVIPASYVPGSATAVSIPLLASLAATTTYWIVINAVGDASDYYTWSKSNQTSGASTSTNGTSWSAQTYGLLYNLYAGLGGALVHTYEDAGARWTSLAFNTNGSLATLEEYTIGQGAGQYMYSGRSYSYTSGSLTAIT